MQSLLALLLVLQLIVDRLNEELIEGDETASGHIASADSVNGRHSGLNKWTGAGDR